MHKIQARMPAKNGPDYQRTYIFNNLLTLWFKKKNHLSCWKGVLGPFFKEAFYKMEDFMEEYYKTPTSTAEKRF